MRLAAILTLCAAAVLVVAGCGGDSGGGDESATSSTVCDEVSVPEARDSGGQTEPKERLDPEKTYTLTLETNCGDFTVTLDQSAAPATAASLVALAGDGFYDDTVFHRIVPNFVIQGGDPTQTGAGGPGYTTVDPPPQDSTYKQGVVAMAKTQQEPAGAAGSQFFVVTGSDIGLPPEYAIVGNVSQGMDVVERIGQLGDASEQPTEPVVIKRVTVDETG